MKRLIYFVAVACVALVGCTKNEALAPTEGTSDQLITFESPVLGVSTKAEVVGYPTSYPSFHVLGKLHKGTYAGWTTSGTYEIGDYMDTEVVYEDGLDPKTWKPSPYDYYWPKNENDYKLSFLAYSPNNATGASIGETGVKFTNYEVTTGDPNVDLLYSLMTYNQTASNVTGSPAYATPEVVPAYQGVNIHFKHALSSINFKVKTAEDYTTTAQIKLTGITLEKVCRKGNFNEDLQTATPEASHGPIDHIGTPTWSDQTLDDGTYTVTLGALGEITTTSQVAGNQLILLPQSLINDVVPSTQYAVITYTMQSKIDGTLSGPVVPCEAKVPFYGNTGDNKWEIGKKYIYTIIISLGKIYFAPEIVDWEEGSTTDITI